MDAMASWHAAGLRWIGSLFTGAADYLEQRSPAALEPMHQQHAADYLDDMRSRIQNRAHLL